MSQPISESQALRILDLPSSRREWLRSKLAPIEAGGQLLYDRPKIMTLLREIEAARKVSK